MGLGVPTAGDLVAVGVRTGAGVEPPGDGVATGVEPPDCGVDAGVAVGGADGVVLGGELGLEGVCALQRPHERRQYGPLSMKAEPHFPN